jgi:hypothetical protein
MASLIAKEQLNHFQVKKMMQESIGMVENAWSTISLCWVCSPTNIGNCWFLDWGKESL